MLTMYDSVTVAELPPGADAYLGYVDGRFANSAEVKAKFPGARVLTIAVYSSSDAEAADCEAGDMTPAEIPGWVKRQEARGVRRPVVYAAASEMRAVLSALSSAGVERSQVRLLSAHYGAGEHICSPDTCAYPGVPACDGTQWTDRALGRNLDQSVLLDDFFAPGAHVDEITHTADGKMSLVRIAQEAHSQPSSVLRRTAVHDQKFAPELAQWLNAVFAGHLPATAPVPAGVKLRVPA